MIKENSRIRHTPDNTLILKDQIWKLEKFGAESRTEKIDRLICIVEDAEAETYFATLREYM